MSKPGTPARKTSESVPSGFGVSQPLVSGPLVPEPLALLHRLSGSGSSADCVSEACTAGDNLAAPQPAVAAPRNGLENPGQRHRLLIAAAAAGGLLAAVIFLAQPALAAGRGSASPTSSPPVPSGSVPSGSVSPGSGPSQAPSAGQSGSQGASPSPSPSPSPSSSPPTAVAFGGTPAVGALFTVKRGKPVHFCTAAVVQSPHGDLAITAAHCMQGRRLGSHGTVTFAPGYHDGKFPYGRWLVRSEFVDENWKLHQDANDDFAFLVVGKAGQRIQRRTGGESLETYVPLPQNAEVTGYPDATNKPVKCSGPAKRLHLKGYRQMVFDCGGFTNGTSGGPFLRHVSRKTGRGGIFGVIGGYQKGGDTASVSYSALFQRNVADLFKQASA